MELSLLNNLPDIVFSADIQDLEFSATEGRYNFKLYRSGETLLDIDLYSFDGHLTLYELRSAVEDYMIKENLAVCKFSLSSLPASMGNPYFVKDFTVIFCARSLMVDVINFTSHNFLTTSSAKKLTLAGSRISYFAKKGDVTTPWYVIWARINGEIISKRIQGDDYEAQVDETVCLEISLRKFAEMAQLAQDSILAITVEVDDRQINFYVDRSLQDVAFLYRNNWNVEEEFICRAVTVGKLDVDRVMAVSDRESQFYNQRSSKIYEIQTEPLSHECSVMLEQLLESHDVRLLIEGEDFEECPKILITDMTSEIEDNKLNCAKFSWRFADNRPHIKTDMGSYDGRIFSEQYKAQFK